MRLHNQYQVLLVVFLAALTACLYFLPKKILNNSKPVASSHTDAKPSQQETKEKSVKMIVDESILEVGKSSRDRIARFNMQLESASNDSDKVKAIDGLFKEYMDLNNAIGLAYILEEKVAITHSKNDEDLVEYFYYEAFLNSQVEENRKVITDKLIAILEKSIKETSDKAGIHAKKIKLAQAYVEGTGEIMKAIPLLKDVEREDPKNVIALEMLGKLSIQSGQMDKAKERFKRLIEIDPKNPDYYLYLAQVFKSQGDIANAVITLENAKKYINNKVYLDSLNNLIVSLKKSN